MYLAENGLNPMAFPSLGRMQEEVVAVLHDLADGLRVSAVALAAYLPETAERILSALGQPIDLSWGRVAAGGLETAAGIHGAAPLFPRIETHAS